MDVIIYKNPLGNVTVVIPTEEALRSHSIQEIAEKDVPAGLPFKIIPATDVPADRTFRNAWDVDEAILTDGVGAEHDMFITDPAHPNYVAPAGGAE